MGPLLCSVRWEARLAELPLVGVVAIGRNEGERFRRCLASIPPGLPTVYVDSASTDGSVDLARRFGASVVELDLSRPFTAARARNEGFARLLMDVPDIEFVQFVDGDCELERTWLATAVEFLDRHPGAAAVCGRRRERHPERSFYNRLQDFEWDAPVGRVEACGGDALMRVSALRQSGGYDASLMAGEEPELCARLRATGWSVWRLAAPMTVHDAAIYRFSQWWRRAVRSGFGCAQVWARTRSRGVSLYRREVLSALGWALGVPLAALVLALAFGPVAGLFLPLVWLVQLVRLGLRFGPRRGALLLVGKLAESVGIARFLLARLARRDQAGIHYK